MDDEDVVAVLELVAGPLWGLDDLFVDGDGEMLVLGEFQDLEEELVEGGLGRDG